jgi:hypothetical protein
MNKTRIILFLPFFARFNIGIIWQKKLLLKKFLTLSFPILSYPASIIHLFTDYGLMGGFVNAGGPTEKKAWNKSRDIRYISNVSVFIAIIDYKKK